MADQNIRRCLPDEVLLTIIHHARRDLKTLHSLLTVDCFFFHATVPVLYQDPFQVWDRSSYQSFARANFDYCLDLMRLLVVSTLQYTSEDPVKVFEKAGLRLTQPLESLVCYYSQPLTVDYARFCTKPLCKNFPRTQNLVHLMQRPGGAVASWMGTVDETIPLEEQTHPLFVNDVQRRLGLALMHRCCRNVTMLGFDLEEALDYWEVSRHLERLQTLEVGCSTDVFHSRSVNSTVHFIEVNQSTFKEKAPLEIKFKQGWREYDNRAYLGQANKNFLLKRLYTPQAQIYLAVGRPSSITQFDLPGVYELYQTLGTDRLVRFTHDTWERLELSEVPYQETFLARCTRLQVFHGAFQGKEMFRWVTRAKAQKESVLPELAELHLRSKDGPKELLESMDEASIAFRESLSSIYLEARGHDVPPIGDSMGLTGNNVLDKMMRKEDIAILTRPVCQWDLPRLCSLTLLFQRAKSIHMGSLDGCPNLENLTLSAGDLTMREGLVLRAEDRPFPQWNLPRLRKLYLLGLPALLFGYNSLEVMDQLERLELRADDQIERQAGCWDFPNLADIQETDQGQPAWPWKLPKLQTLYLSGHPARLFSLDRISSCPALTSVDLFIKKWPQPILRDHYSTAEVVIPLVTSQLTHIVLSGPWEITSNHLKTVLGTLCPNLLEFRLRNTDNASSTVRGVELIQAILEVDKICAATLDDSGSPLTISDCDGKVDGQGIQRGHPLESVSLQCFSLLPNEKDDYGLVTMPMTTMASGMVVSESPYGRQYWLRDGCLVHKEAVQGVGGGKKGKKNKSKKKGLY